MSYVIYTKESCRVPHVDESWWALMSHGATCLSKCRTFIVMSCPPFGWVMDESWWALMSHGATCLSKCRTFIVMSCPPFGWVMDESRMRHAHMNAVSHTWITHGWRWWVMKSSYSSKISTCLIRDSSMTHPNIGHDMTMSSYSSKISTFRVMLCPSHDSSKCGTRHSHVVCHIWMSHGWVMVGVDEWWSHMTHPSVGHVIVMSCATSGWVMDESWWALMSDGVTWLIRVWDTS